MATGLYVYTIIHTVISLLALLAGLVVIRQMFASRIEKFWTQSFLVLAIVTSATGFGFPFNGITPALIVGVVALMILAGVLAARYGARLAGVARWIYTVGMVASVYLLAFVTVAQAFKHVPALQPLAPTGSEPPFAVAQLAVLIVFIALGILAVRRFRPATV